MFVDNVKIKIDIEFYLVKRGLSKVQTRRDEVFACCPFHNERTPSFSVNVDTGAFKCFGCREHGNIVDLVKRLERFATHYEAQQWLIINHGVLATIVDKPLDLAFDVSGNRSAPYSIDESVLAKYRYRHPYLEKRGITDKTQRVFGIGHSRDARSITFPYRDHSGRLLTVKHRGITQKRFWYEPPMPSRIKAATLWGLDVFIRQTARGLRKLALTEAEIDGMSVFQAGIFGVAAIGGNQMTDEQAALLVNVLPSDVEILVFTDNDAGGYVAKQIISEKLLGRFSLSSVDWSPLPTAKDANDVPTESIRELINLRREIPLFSI